MEYSNTVRNKFTKFLGLTFKDKLKTVVYSFAFHLFILLFMIFGYKKTRGITDKIIGTENSSSNFNKEYIERESTIIGYAAGNSLFNSSCLEKSLFTYLIFGIHGLKTELKFGVNNTTGDFSAHAWVEYRGTIVNDYPEVIGNISPFKKI